MAANDTTLADEDGDFEDWVEIYNTGPEAVSLSGWYLTVKANKLTKWTFPAVTVPADGYLVVFTSGKERNDPAGTLHTNFSLSAGGEYLGLVRPDGETVAYEFAPEYPAQITDVSYGVAGSGADAVIGYLAEATPGQPNGETQDIILDASVSFSTPSTSFHHSMIVTMAGAEDGRVIRYTLSDPSESGGDTPVPTATSPIYTGPLEIAGSTVIKAAVFAAEGENHGVISTIQLLETDGDGSTGIASFRTGMPVIVVDNHGAGPMEPLAFGGKEVPGWLYAYEPGADTLTRLTSGPDASTAVSFRVRGQTSSLYPKKGFRFDMLDEWGVKRPFNLLGLGRFDEWNMVAPYRWDTSYVRNAFSYDVSNAIGRWAGKTRLAEAFLNTDEDGLTMADYHGLVVMVDKTDVEPGRIEMSELDKDDNEGEAVTCCWWMKPTSGNMPGLRMADSRRRTDLLSRWTRPRSTT